MNTTAVATTRDENLSIFSQTMGLVAITCLFAAGGAYIGKDLGGMWWILPWLVSFGCLFGLYAANRREKYSLAMTLLFVFGLLLGITVGNTLNYYAINDQGALYQAAGATGLFVALLGAGGYAIRKDLSFLYRFLFIGLIVFLIAGIALIFINMPGAYLVWSILGLVLFGGYTVVDFNRLRRAGQNMVIPIAAGIFLNIFNIFLLFLRIFGGSR